MKARTERKPASSRRTAGPPPSAAADKLFEAVMTQLLNEAGVSKSKMFGSEGLKMGSKVFAMLVKGRLVLKLPKERVDALVASGDGHYFDPGHGRLMKEWVAITPGTKGEWLSLAKKARDFVAATA